MFRRFPCRAKFSLGGGAQGTSTTLIKPYVAGDSRDSLVGVVTASQEREFTSNRAAGDPAATASSPRQGDITRTLAPRLTSLVTFSSAQRKSTGV